MKEICKHKTNNMQNTETKQEIRSKTEKKPGTEK